MSLFRKFIGPLGYKRTDYNNISHWAQDKCRSYQKGNADGWKYFTGASHLYAIYYHGDGSYTIYRKRK